MMMARLKRLNVPGGLYFVVVRGNAGDTVFEDADDYEEFSSLVAGSLRRYRCHMHAFCWLSNQALMAVQVKDLPIGRFVQRAAGHYARRLNAKRKRRGHVFEHHHRQLLVQRSRYLLPLVRYIHRAPVRGGLVAEAEDYVWSGDQAFRGMSRVPWLTTHVVREMLLHARKPGPMSYAEWMSLGDDENVVKLFEHGRRGEHRAIGDDAFIAEAAGMIDSPARTETLDDIIDRTVLKSGTSRSLVISGSRRRRYVLIRAIIAWEATQAGVATLSEVASRLGRDPSTVWAAMERYRQLKPELFPDHEPFGSDEAIDAGGKHTDLILDRDISSIR